jgi:drug/metabolite transporter (DMT)-like permease
LILNETITALALGGIVLVLTGVALTQGRANAHESNSISEVDEA